MRFWDSSAVVSLVVDEPDSGFCRRLWSTESHAYVWILTRTEVVSALQRRRRLGELDGETLARALARVSRLMTKCHEISEMMWVRNEAERLLADHPLRAADALQLGAALVAAGGRPKRRPVVSLDTAVITVARAIGFDVPHPRQ